MKRFLPLLALLLALPLSALADRAENAELYGSAFNAGHLSMHIGSMSHGWNGDADTLPRDDCAAHVRCCAGRIAFWDTPKKGDNDVLYMSGTKLGYLTPASELELLRIVSYKGHFFANIRTYADGHPATAGWVDADYICCSCAEAWEAMPVEEWDEISTVFTLR